MAPFLVLKPAVILSCTLGSVQLRAVYTKDGVEEDVTADTVFTSFDPAVAVIGASSGNATGVAEGTTTFQATYNDGTTDYVATSMVNVLGENCCEDQTVAIMVLVDNSRSMSQSFGAGYTTRLAYAKAAAIRLIDEVNESKDVVGLLKFNDALTEVLSDPITDKSAVSGLVPAIPQTQQLTSFHEAITQAVGSLNGVSADQRILIIISDGEDSTASYNDSNNPIAAIDDFKSSGGIVMCLGVRSHGRGFALLSRLATGGFFVNGYGTTAAEALNYISGLKGYICADNCAPEGDEYVAAGAFNYNAFTHWNVTGGSVDLQGNGFFDYLPGNGLFVDLISGNQSSGDSNGVMTLKDADGISIEAGNTYRLTVTLAGNQQVNRTDTVKVNVFWKQNDAEGTPVNIISQTIVLTDYTKDFSEFSYAFTADADRTVFISIQQANAPTGDFARAGVLLLSVKFDDVTDLATLFEDDFDSENLTYVPPRCGKVGYDYSYAPCCDYAITGTEPVVSSHHSVIFPNNESYVTRESALTGAENNKLGTISIWAKCSPGSEFFVAGNNSDQSFLVKFGSTDVIDILAFSDAGSTLILNLKSTNAIADDQWHHVVASWDLSDVNKRHLYVDGVDRIDPAIYVDSDILWEHTEWTVGPQAGGGASTSLVYEYFMDNSYIDLSIAGNLAKFISGGNPVSPGPDGSLITGEPPLIYFRKAVPDWQENQGRGGDFIANGTIIDGGDDVPGGTALVDSTEGQTVTITDNCPDCLTSPPPAQLQDPSPLADIEGGYSPPTTYSSTKTKCATCPVGFNNVSDVNLIPAMTSNTAPSGVASASSINSPGADAFKAFNGVTSGADFTWQSDAGEAMPQWVRYSFAAAKTVHNYAITGYSQLYSPKDFTFEGSNDGSTWTVLDTQSNKTWYLGETKMFAVATPASYLHYRLNVTALPAGIGDRVIVSELEMFGASESQVCATATETSETSQQDADSKANEAALEAAQEQLNCMAAYTATESYTAMCPVGSFGSEITKSATRTSFVSLQEAQAMALEAATAEALDALNCALSNNNQAIQFNNGTIVSATPYPSVQHVTGAPESITKVTVTLVQVQHYAFQVACLMLRAPDGTCVMLLNPDNGSGEMVFTTPQDVTFDDDAAATMPYGNPHPGGTFKPTIIPGGETLQFPGSAPAQPYGVALSDFIGLDGNGSWSLWAIHKQFYTVFNPVNAKILNGWFVTIN